MITSLFLKELRSCIVPWAIVLAVLGMYAGTIFTMYDPEMGESLELMRQSMPELFAAFGMGDQGSTLLEFLVNYLYGFLFVAFPLVLILLLANRLVVRYLDTGGMACLLAQPIGRARLMVSQFLVLLSCLAAMLVLVTLMEACLAEALFPGELSLVELCRANVSLAGLWLMFSGVCWASVCLVPRPSWSLWGGAAVCIAAILVQMLSGAGDGLSWLGNFTPLALFDPLGMAYGEPFAAVGCAVLALSGIALACVGIAGFSRRDLAV